MTRIFQLLPVLSYGDAIGGATLATDSFLKAAGFETYIFADVLDSKLAHRAAEARHLRLSDIADDDLVIYRMAIGSRLAYAFLELPGRKAVVFHNITPPSYYEQISPRVTSWLERGYEELGLVVEAAELVIADSSFNMQTALAAGAGKAVVIPPPVDLHRLSPRQAVPAWPPMLLSVGRLVPNKRPDTILSAFAALTSLYAADAELVLAGTATDAEIYLDALMRLASELSVEEKVRMDGTRISDEELGALYSQAALFVSASEHEGFCVPVVEAMMFGVPIVARAAGAVPETAGDAALLVESEDPLEWGELLGRALYDEQLRRHLVASGKRRVLDFSMERIAAAWNGALASMGIAP